MHKVRQIFRSKSQLSTFLNGTLATVIISIILLYPAYINGGAFWFPDTTTYIRSADGATAWLTGSTSEWSDRISLGGGGEEELLTDSGSEGSTSLSYRSLVPQRPVLTGRSIYYGFLLYVPMRIGGAWLAILLQSIIVSSLLYFCFSILRREVRSALFVRISLIIALFFLIATPLPFYTTMLMPDIYAGLIVLLSSLAVLYWDKISPRERFILVGSAAIMATFHTTLLLLAVTTALAAVVLNGRRTDWWKPFAILAPVIIVAVVSGAAFDAAIQRVLGHPPVSPPFLSSRLVADGPGTTYLREHCDLDRDRWALCNHVNKFPIESDELLWNQSGARSVFMSADYREMRRLGDEDKAFFLAVLADQPMEVLGYALSGTGTLLFGSEFPNFNYTSGSVLDNPEKYPPALFGEISSSRAARGTMPVEWIGLLTSALNIVGVACVVLVGALNFSGKLQISKSIWRLVLLLTAGWLANAVICGALSSPTERYQMRLAWLMPLAAVVLVTNARCTSLETSPIR